MIVGILSFSNAIVDVTNLRSFTLSNKLRAIYQRTVHPSIICCQYTHIDISTMHNWKVVDHKTQRRPNPGRVVIPRPLDRSDSNMIALDFGIFMESMPLDKILCVGSLSSCARSRRRRRPVHIFLTSIEQGPVNRFG